MNSFEASLAPAVVPAAAAGIAAPRPDIRALRTLRVQRYWRLLQRLCRMSPAEAASRSARASARCVPAALRARSLDRRRRACRKTFLDALGSQRAGRVSARLDSRFFFGPADRQVRSQMLYGDCPGDALRAVARAERATREGLDLLGVRIRLVPGEVDWQADPRSRRRAWSLGPLDEAAAIRAEGADVKHVWELSRHQFLTVFGRAYWASGDSRFARQAAALIDDWIRANPYGRGVNWSSHLEVAIRAMSWLWTMPFLLAWPDLDEEFLERWLGSLADHHTHLAANLSVYSDPTNHLLGETTALWMLSTVFAELPDAAIGRARAMDILAREIERQITADGVNVEHAIGYHRFVLDFLIQILALARRIEEPVPPILRERTEAALGFVAALMGPDGRMPMIGDGDDARGLPFPETTGGDYRDLLSTGAALFGRPDWKARAEGLAESTVWLLGPEARHTFHRVPGGLTKAPSTIYASGGYCVFSAEAPRLQVDSLLDVGPLGLWPNAAHGHADALSLLIRVNGELLLGDPGTGTYFADPAVRNWFRSTAAHNTLAIDHLDQADMFDVFKWVNPMRVELLGSFSGRHVAYAAARHDGYRRLRQAVTHYRHVLFSRPRRWAVVDRLQGAGCHTVTRQFHFPPGTVVCREPSGSFSAVSPATGAGLRFTFGDSAAPGISMAADTDALWSERYGSWQQAPRLTVECRATMPLALCTFISAFAAGDEARAEAAVERCDARQWPGQQATAWRRTDASGADDLVLVNPRACPVALPDGRLTDASFLSVARTAEGSAECAFLEFGSPGRSGKAGRRSRCEERIGLQPSFVATRA